MVADWWGCGVILMVGGARPARSDEVVGLQRHHLSGVVMLALHYCLERRGRAGRPPNDAKKRSSQRGLDATQTYAVINSVDASVVEYI